MSIGLEAHPAPLVVLLGRGDDVTRECYRSCNGAGRVTNLESILRMRAELILHFSPVDPRIRIRGECIDRSILDLCAGLSDGGFVRLHWPVCLQLGVTGANFPLVDT
jgi:hypothetical protein